MTQKWLLCSVVTWLQDVASKLHELAAARGCSLTVLAASGALSSATLKQASAVFAALL